ncbi:PsbP-related protein [Desulfobacula sp.]|uniref:PsbP-related protein n=1 Tax=Desulfobacula sp. TaxID=2593537 RepID=UPI00262ECDBB|nr:PsbP-related protein [Desulfobacula sp.]
MKTICTVLICILLIFNFSTVMAIPLEKTFTDETYGYQIQYPAKWKARIYRSGIVIAEINSPTETAGFQIRFTKSDKSHAEYKRTYIAKYKKDLNAILINQKERKINGMAAVEYNLKGGRNGTFYLKSYIIFKNHSDNIFIIQAGSPFSQMGETDLLFSLMAESFRIYD